MEGELDVGTDEELSKMARGYEDGKEHYSEYVMCATCQLRLDKKGLQHVYAISALNLIVMNAGECTIAETHTAITGQKSIFITMRYVIQVTLRKHKRLNRMHFCCICKSSIRNAMLSYNTRSHGHGQSTILLERGKCLLTSIRAGQVEFISM